MSDMEEISYWVYTKQAPCLYNYDNQIKRQLADALCSAQPKPASAPSDVQEVPTPRKKAKRKLSLLGDESASPEKQQNVFFETSQQHQRTMLSSCKSDTVDSEIDFNIKNSSIQNKRKRMKVQKNNRTVHKKNKVVTSTPKTETTLRRSLRRTQRLNNNTQMQTSLETFTGNARNNGTRASKHEPRKTPQKTKRDKCIEKNADGDHNTKVSIGLDKIKKNGVLNQRFEDLSDVSGLTANYIRSTKVQATQCSRNLRSKVGKNTTSQSQQELAKGDVNTATVCANKSVNTSQHPKADVLNCSTDSSQNIINFVTTQNSDKTPKVNKSTSLLKFVDTRTPKVDNPNGKETKTNLNASSQSQCSRARYPTRHKRVSGQVTETDSRPTDNNETPQRATGYTNSSDRKENPEESTISRTRSGRSIGLAARRPRDSVLVYNNSTDVISSGLSVNVAGQCLDQPEHNQRKKKRLSSSRQGRSEHKSTDRSDLALRQATSRDRSGFAACFSESDQESEPIKQRKFFC